MLSMASAYCQPDLEYKRMLAAYPGEHVVLLKNHQHLYIEIIDGQLSVKSSTYVERMFLDTQAGVYSEGYVNYSDMDKIVKIEAGTMVPHKNKYAEIKVKDFKDKEHLSHNVFFDGSRSVSFLYPSLHAGAKSFLKYDQIYTEPRLISSFYFQGYIPSVESIYNITVGEGVDLGWNIFNGNDSIISFTKTSGKNHKTTYTWVSRKMEKYHHDIDAPDFRYSMPHMIAWIKSYKTGNVTHQLLSSPKDLYQWYHSITKNFNSEESPELHHIVDSLTAGVNDQFEKVRRIYYWVEDNIKYIAFENGMGGFVPRSAKAVCDKRYGDCKDMAGIIYKMLSYAKVPSHLTWIGSRGIPYRYSDLPTPAVDNHMITTYIENGKYFFLDATGQYMPLGLPTAFIQGKQALIGIDSTHFEIIEVPVTPASASQRFDSVNISISNNKISGTGISYMSGYLKIDLSRILYNHLNNPAEVLRGYYQKGNNKFLIDSIRLSDYWNRDERTRIDYRFTIDDYVKVHESELYINMNLDKNFQNEEIKKVRVLDIENDFNYNFLNIIVLKIPPNTKISYVPVASSFKDERFGFDFQYSQAGNTITLTQKIYSNILMLKKSDFDAWNKMIKELKKAYSEIVILKKQ
jgi:Transglutaminase-like superfamily